MRPARAAPVVPFVTLPLHWNPNACTSDHRGVSDPVVPFKPPCLLKIKLESGETVARSHCYSRTVLRPAARPAALAVSPTRLRTRPLGPSATGPATATGTAYDLVIRTAA